MSPCIWEGARFPQKRRQQGVNAMKSCKHHAPSLPRAKLLMYSVKSISDQHQTHCTTTKDADIRLCIETRHRRYIKYVTLFTITVLTRVDIEVGITTIVRYEDVLVKIHVHKM